MTGDAVYRAIFETITDQAGVEEQTEVSVGVIGLALLSLDLTESPWVAACFAFQAGVLAEQNRRAS